MTLAKNYHQAVRAYLRGDEDLAQRRLQQLTSDERAWAQPLLEARLRRRAGQLGEAERILNNTSVPHPLKSQHKSYINAEITEQRAQILRTTNPCEAEKLFLQASEKFLQLGAVEKSRNCTFNAVASIDPHLKGPHRLRPWVRLRKKASEKEKPLIDMYLGLIARDRGQAEGYHKLQSAAEFFAQTGQVQNQAACLLTQIELAYLRGDLPILSRSFKDIDKIFSLTPLPQLRGRYTLSQAMFNLLSGQWSRADGHLKSLESTSNPRPLDLWQTRVLRLQWCEKTQSPDDKRHRQHLLQMSDLNEYQGLQREILQAQWNQNLQTVRELSEQCRDSQFEALIPEHLLLETDPDELQIYPAERMIKYRGQTKIFRSHSKTFELLVTLASLPEKTFTKDEIIQLVWNRTPDEFSGNDNVFHVGLSNLRKIVGSDRIQQSGNGYVWNTRQRFTLIRGSL